MIPKMSEIHRSRQRIAGRKISDPQEFDKLIKQAILDRINKGIYSPSVIGEQLGKHRSTINRYVKELVADGKVKLTETGRIEKVEALVQRQEFEELELDAFLERYPSVKRWVDDMMVRKGGKPLTRWKVFLQCLKGVCDILKVNPEMLISSKEALEQFTRSFILEWRKTSNESPHLRIMVLRNYAMANGITWPRGVSGLMSGKKESFGKYAHIKLSDEEIARAIRVCPNEEVRDWFAIGIETAARHGALHTIDISNIEEFSGYMTLRAFESKTNKSWTKYIVNPTVQQIVRRRVATQRASGHAGLFLNGKTEIAFGDYINRGLKELYRSLGITEPYFYSHPTHVLRHIGAHHWLRLTNYNYTLVAKIGGWEDVNTLIKCYGEMPAEVVIKELAKARELMG